MQEYNTKEIRAAAARLTRLAEKADRMRRTDIRRIVGNAEEMRGDSVAAIETQAESLDGNIRDIARMLTNSANALYAFARRLDEADAKARSMMQSR